MVMVFLAGCPRAQSAVPSPSASASRAPRKKIGPRVTLTLESCTPALDTEDTSALDHAICTAIVSNQGDESIDLIDDFMADSESRYTGLHVRVVDDHGRQIPFNAIIDRRGSPPVVRLAPKSHVARQFDLSAYDVPPGRYEISATYRSGETELRSNTVTLIMPDAR